MQLRLLRRLKKLEETIHPPPSHTFRYGWRIPLPPDFVGERYVVAENVLQIEPGLEWCDFVEYPGPVPKSLAGARVG